MPQQQKFDGIIEHHGIKGMHWGVRRTPEQLGHPRSTRKQSRAEKQAANDQKRRNAAVNSRANAKTIRKGVDKLSDEELRAKLNRIQMEQSLKELERKQKPEIQRMMEDVMKEVGKNEARRVLQKGADELVDAIIYQFTQSATKGKR